MTTGKSQRRTRETAASGEAHQDGASAAGQERREIPPDPPKRNRPLLALAIVLFLVWLAYLLTVAWLANRGGGAP